MQKSTKEINERGNKIVMNTLGGEVNSGDIRYSSRNDLK